MNKSTQIKLIFLIFGDVFNPQDFTNLVKISPMETWLKGEEVKINSLIRKRSSLPVRKESAWQYTEGYVQTLFFEDISKKFEDIFGKKKYEIRDFIKKNNLDATINVVVEIVGNQTPSLFLSKSFITLLSDIGLELDFDLYVLENE